MFTRRFVPVINQKLCGHTLLRDNQLPQIIRAYGIEYENIMDKWREKEADLHRSKATDDPNLRKKILWHPTYAPKESDFSLGNIVNWYMHSNIKTTKHDQRFIAERHKILGTDLASSYFILARGGRVKFYGNADWIEKDEKGSYNLPKKFDPMYSLEAIDINGIDLHYEGLSNICGLVKLKWLSLKNCKNIDDWGLDKISAEYPQLEYLDISGCNITERGLESLYRMTLLKKLIVTNYNKSAAFELTCMMLEDCVLDLTCEILIPGSKAIE